jgi:hypothetical protein
MKRLLECGMYCGNNGEMKTRRGRETQTDSGREDREAKRQEDRETD